MIQEKENAMKVIGRIVIVIALTVVVVPWFTDCESQGNAIVLPNGQTIPMRCHWTGKAEWAAAGPLAAVGVLMLLAQRRETLRALSIVSIVLGVFVILLPTVLIGVCSSELMLCSMVMKPTLVMAGILTVATSLAGLLLSRQVAFSTLVTETDAR